MLALAAARLGLGRHIFAPEADSPAFDVCAARTIAAYEDGRRWRAFAARSMSSPMSSRMSRRGRPSFCRAEPVRPGPAALAASQDRLVEKDFLTGLGIATAPYLPVDDAGALARAVGAARPARRSSRPGASAMTARARR